MNDLSKPRRINVAALLLAAAAITLIYVSAPDLFPAVPPGPIILAAAAAIVALAPGRWTPLIGVIVPLAIFIGGLSAPQSTKILDGAQNAGAIAGLLVELPMLAVAVIAGAIGLRLPAVRLRREA